MRKKILFFAILFISTIDLWAYDFQVDGICYNIITTNTPNSVEVTKGINYIGVITIPTSVSNNGILYPVNSIGNNAFSYQSGLTSLVIPNTILSIGNSAFEGCSSLSTITIPNSVTSIGDVPFLNNNLSTINVDENNLYFMSDNGILFNKNKTEIKCCPTAKTGAIIIPNSVTSIAHSAFYSCRGLTSVMLSNSLTSISEGAFAECSGLTSIAIPSSVSFIGPVAFFNCIAITSVHVKSTSPIDLSNSFWAFNGVSSACKLFVPIGSKSVYQNAVQWKDFFSIVEESTSTNIQGVKASELNLTTKNNKITLKNLSIGEVVRINEIDGKLVFMEKAKEQTFETELLPNKMYIVSVGAKCAKLSL